MGGEGLPGCSPQDPTKLKFKENTDFVDMILEV
jgi:hypothetical protein